MGNDPTWDRGVNRGIVARGLSRGNVSSLPGQGPRSLLLAIEAQPGPWNRVISSIRKRLRRGQYPTVRQLEYVNDWLEARGASRVACGVRTSKDENPIVRMRKHNAMAAAEHLDQISSARPLSPPRASGAAALLTRAATGTKR